MEDNTANLNIMDLKDVYDKIMNGEDVIVRILVIEYLLKNKNLMTQRVFHEVLQRRCLLAI